MNGQLSEQPLAELIREISAKSVGGRLQLQHDRIKAVIYFAKGELLYAASNLRQLRLREYLLKAGISEGALGSYDERQPDLELARALTRDQILSPATAEQIQTRQVSDVIRLALSWPEGTWDFDQRSRLNEDIKLTIDTRSLLLEAGRRMSAKFVVTRFRVPNELISPLAAPQGSENLLPTEVFLLSRLDRPTPLNELLAVSGLSENETLVLVYSLGVAGLLQREHWKSSFGSQPPAAVEPEPVKPAVTEPPPPEEQPTGERGDVDSFLARLTNAQTHYEVLDVSDAASPAHMKQKYYDLARNYHPDRFRKADPALLAQMESSFARVTQAYDTLRDEQLRANYDAKLKARQKAQQIADASPKTSASPVTPVNSETRVKDAVASLAERAAAQFKEGLAALELGERKAAVGLFAAAANAVPNEPRYRASFGKLLAEQEHTRRAAETELQAAIKLDPKNSDYRATLAELYRDLGLLLRARGEAERALAIDPENRKARDLLHALKSV